MILSCGRKIWTVLLWAAIVLLLSWMAHPSRGDTACPPGVVCENGVCHLAPQRPTVPVKRPATNKAAVARIFVDTRSGRNVGSGTVIEGGDILTCAHLFEGKGKIVAVFPDGSSHKAHVVAVDRAWDLALLRIAQPRQGVKIATDAPKVGQWMRSCGYGSNGIYQCKHGQVMGYVQAHGTSPFETLDIRGAVRQGDSGGPIFNQRGELAGVIWGASWRRGQTAGTYCGRIRKFLQRVLGVTSPRERPVLGVTSPPTFLSPGSNLLPPSVEVSNPPAVKPDSRIDGLVDSIKALRAQNGTLGERLTEAVKKGIRERFDGLPKPADNSGRFDKIDMAVKALKERLANTPDRDDSHLGEIMAKLGGLSKHMDGLSDKSPGVVQDVAGARVSAAAITTAATALGFTAPPVAVVWFGVVLFRRWRRKRREDKGQPVPVPQTATPPTEPETKKEPAEPADGFSGLPRDDTEAVQLLRLSMLEGRDPVHDAIVGRFAYDEIKNIVDAGGTAAEWAAGLRRKLEERFNDVVPLALHRKKEV